MRNRRNSALLLRQLSHDDEAKKEKYFNQTLVDLDMLNLSSAEHLQARDSASRKNGDESSDDENELLDLLQDLGEERDVLLVQVRYKLLDVFSI